MVTASPKRFFSFFRTFWEQINSLVGFLNEKKSYDRGIDIFSQPLADGAYVACQSKLRISSTEELDSILSKFSVYERVMFCTESDVLFSEESEPNVTYVIATGFRLGGH